MQKTASGAIVRTAFWSRPKTAQPLVGQFRGHTGYHFCPNSTFFIRNWEVTFSRSRVSQDKFFFFEFDFFPPKSAPELILKNFFFGPGPAHPPGPDPPPRT